jgi:Fe-S oxidoreductase
MKNADRQGDIDTFFETMERDLKMIIAGHAVVTEDGHCCDFIFQLFKTYMLEKGMGTTGKISLHGSGVC